MLKCAPFLPLLGPPRVLGRWLPPAHGRVTLKKASKARESSAFSDSTFVFESILESQHTRYSIIPRPMMWRCGLTRPLQHCRQRLHCTCEPSFCTPRVVEMASSERGQLSEAEEINISWIPWRRPINFTGPASRAANMSLSVFVTHHVHAVARARPKQMAWPLSRILFWAILRRTTRDC